jgi:hypothetical protein
VTVNQDPQLVREWILWIAGVAVLVSGLAGVAVHSAGYMRLERDQGPTPPADEPGS